PVSSRSRVRDLSPKEVGTPASARITAVVRAGAVHAPEDCGPLLPGDYIHVLARAEDVARLNEVFSDAAYASEHQYFGDFVLDANARLADIAQIYGFSAEGQDDVTVGDYVHRAFRKRPVVGDSVRFGRVELVVREVVRQRVTRVGLKI